MFTGEVTKVIVVPHRTIRYNGKIYSPRSQVEIVGPKNIGMVGYCPSPSKFALIEVYMGQNKIAFTSDRSSWRQVDGESSAAMGADKI